MASHVIFISLILLLSSIYTINALSLPFGNFEQPGSGFIPLILGVIACAISLGLLINFLRNRLKDTGGEKEPYLWRAILCVVIFVVYVLLLPLLGYLIATTLFVITLFKILGIDKWVTAIGGGMIIGIICYVLFNFWLKVPLPNGFWLP